MKHIFLSLSLLCILNIYSQNKKFVLCDIKYENGTVARGYVKNVVNVKAEPLTGLETLENLFDLDRKNFIFKEDQNSSDTMIPAEDIRSIVIYPDNDTVIYDKMRTKTVNVKNEVVELDQQIFLPLLRKGKLDFYGFYYITREKAFSSTNFMGYIKRPEDDFAIKTFDMNRINLLNVWTFEERIFTAFMAVTTDCSAYQNLMAGRLEKIRKKDKSYKKAMKENLQKFIETNRTNYAGMDELTSHYFEYLQIGFIKEYETMCE
jgi:hypothetical protein